MGSLLWAGRLEIIPVIALAMGVFRQASLKQA
jgi:Trk-type K+ transport system membrane component